MKKICMIIILIIISFTTVCATSGEVIDNEMYSVEEEIMPIVEQIIGENIMLVGEVVNARGTAEDLIILAGDIVNSKAIGEYGFMAANNLNISGDVLKDNFVAGNVVNITGEVGRDAYIIGATINLDGVIGRNFYAFGGEININGAVNGNISIQADKVYISSSANISGDVSINATVIEIEESVQIGGVVTYNSTAEDVQIPQNVTNNQNQVVNIDVKEENVFLKELKNIIIWLLINIILFLATRLISPRLFERIEKIYKEKDNEIYLPAIGWGILLIIIIPILSIIALITIIGSALGFVATLAYLVIMVYSTVITGYLIGITIFANKEINKNIVGVLGIIAVEVLRRLPVIGGLISFIIVVIAFGIVKEIMKTP